MAGKENLLMKTEQKQGIENIIPDVNDINLKRKFDNYDAQWMSHNRCTSHIKKYRFVEPPGSKINYVESAINSKL